jgi:hypothetical protein
LLLSLQLLPRQSLKHLLQLQLLLMLLPKIQLHLHYYYLLPLSFERKMAHSVTERKPKLLKF